MSKEPTIQIKNFGLLNRSIKERHLQDIEATSNEHLARLADVEIDYVCHYRNEKKIENLRKLQQLDYMLNRIREAERKLCEPLKKKDIAAMFGYGDKQFGRIIKDNPKYDFKKDKIIELSAILCVEPCDLVGKNEWDKFINNKFKEKFTLKSAQNISSWLENKTKRFVPRKYIFDEFEKFQQENDRGYFSLIGEPGEGKSTIAAKYILGNPCFYYINSRRLGATTTLKFQECICGQLNEHFKLNIKFKPEYAVDGGFLLSILKHISKTLEDNDNLVIVIDAIDEADLKFHRQEESVALYLPEEELPKNIYFFLTWRRDKNIEPLIPSNSLVPSKIYDLKKEEKRCNDSIGLYIESYLEETSDSNDIKKAIKNKEISFVNLLTKKAKRNFMYITLVMPEIINGIYKDKVLDEIRQNGLEDLKLKVLPDNLNKYYKSHWVRMGMMGDNPPIDVRIQVSN